MSLLMGQKHMVARAQGSWSHCVHSEEAERDEGWCSAHFLLFIQSGIPVHRVWELPHGQAQSCVSKVIPIPGRLIMQINS